MAMPTKAQKVLDTKVNLNISNISFEKSLKEVEKIAQVKFSFNSRSLNLDPKVNITASQEALSSVLNSILKAENSDLVIKGVVTNENGEKIPGVNITVKGSALGVMTNSNGEYSIAVRDEMAVLVFSFVGFISQEVSVGKKNNISISLKEDDKTLDEVVVIGYGEIRKRDAIGNVSTISEKDLKRPSTSTFTTSLQGRATGVNIRETSGTPGSPVSVQVRGVNSINTGTDPL